MLLDSIEWNTLRISLNLYEWHLHVTGDDLLWSGADFDRTPDSTLSQAASSLHKVLVRKLLITT
jgi:hypothetical protein